MLRSFAPRALLLALLALALAAAPAAAAPAVSGEFKLQTPLDTNNKITTGPDGNVWVTLQGPEKDVARITPAGLVSEFDLAVAGASGIVTGPDGNLWVTRPGGLTRFATADPEGTVTPFEIAAITGNSPIVTGPDGRLWIATANKLLASSLALPDEPQDVPVPGGTLAPNDIDVAGPLVVVSDFGGSRVVTATVAGATNEIKVGGGPQGVAGSPDGQFAVSQPSTEPREFILLAPPASPIVAPIPGQDPFGVALGADGAYWGAERNSNGLLRLTRSGQVTPLTGFSAGSEPRQITAGPDNTLWVTLPGAGVNSVGRVSGLELPVISPPPPPPPASAPRTRIKAGPKGKLTTSKNFRPVSFGFDSPDPVTAFECRLRKLSPKGKGKGAKGSAAPKAGKAPKFKPCASPKGYKARPGRYRFEVRAVNLGVRDKSPAKRSFRVVRVAG